MKGKRVVLVSSIGDPGYFEETVKDLGGTVLEHIAFPDHHNYRKKDIESIIRRCDERSFDFVVTTEKDAVKFQRLGLFIAKYPLMIVAVEMEIVGGKEGLSARLHSLYTR
jgi:tetraacyldisaccharide 4'-kinase